MQARSLLTLAAAALLAGGCDDDVAPVVSAAPTTSTAAAAPAAVIQAAEHDTPVNPAVVTADDELGLNVLRSLAAGNSGNVAISPLSLAMALQIAYNGATGSTQQAMAQALELGGLSLQQLNDGNAALEATLLNADPNVQLLIANSLWMHLANDPVLPQFTAMDETYYGATVGDLADAPTNVNDWVANETQGLITNILPPGDYGQVVAVLANAVYFKGAWTTAFDASYTTSAPFTLSDGTQVTVDMMNQAGSYLVVAGPQFEAALLPYGNGSFSMLLALPASGISMTQFLGSITAAEIVSWINGALTAQGSIGLPRFTARFGPQSLDDTLQALGMAPAYCPFGDLANLAASACISTVRHATVIEVDENGTTAAGATTVTVPTTIAGPTFAMLLDRPFFYAIVDNRSGELLFMGVMMNPNG